MATVRNDVIIRAGLMDVLKQKGEINLQELEVHLAGKTRERDRDNQWFNETDSSNIVRKFIRDREGKGSQVTPTALKTEEDVATFVSFASRLDDQGGILGFGKNSNGDFADPGTGTLNNDTRLEQALVDDLTLDVNGSRTFNTQKLASALSGAKEPASLHSRSDSKGAESPTRTTVENTTVKVEVPLTGGIMQAGRVVNLRDASGKVLSYEELPDGTLKPIRVHQEVALRPVGMQISLQPVAQMLHLLPQPVATVYSVAA
jgi:hypothetical protein